LDQRLAALADIAVTTAVNLQPGQELVVTAPIEASALVRHVAGVAYRRGARAVTCVYEDPDLIREQLVESSVDGLDYSPPWLSRGIAEALRAGAARLQMLGPYPDLLAGIPIDRIVRAHRARTRASREETGLMSTTPINASAVPVATGAWARQVFPGEPEPAARQRLWDTLFDVLRVTAADPRAAWDLHVRTLNARRDGLQAARFAALRLFDGRTDLTVGLAPDHQWIGGSVTTANGIESIESLPSEQVRTALDGSTASGRVFFSRPLALGGTLVRNLSAEFQDGVVTRVSADRGAGFFERLIASDDGRRLGEVGLVSASSLVARSAVLFWNPLLDTNAASHLAFGPAPASCRRGPEPSRDSPSAAIHIDCMFGHEAMQVDGIRQSGDAVPVMRNGEFVL
jgi:aminopeptidase